METNGSGLKDRILLNTQLKNITLENQSNLADQYSHN
jgi:hypothetical protein